MMRMDENNSTGSGVDESSAIQKLIPPTLPTHGYATVYFYPTIAPRVVVIPILSCIFGFPVLVLFIICALRSRAKKARRRLKQTRMVDYTLTDVSTSNFTQGRAFNERTIRMKNGKRKTIVRFKPMPEIDLDTVVEEKSEFDAELSSSDMMVTPQDIAKRLEKSHLTSRTAKYGHKPFGSVPGYPSSSVHRTGSATIVPSQKHVLHTDLDCVVEEEGAEITEPATNIQVSTECIIESPPSGCVAETHSCQSLLENVSCKKSSTPDSVSDLTDDINQGRSICFEKDPFARRSSEANEASFKLPVKCRVFDIGGRKSLPSIIDVAETRVTLHSSYNYSIYRNTYRSLSCDLIETHMTEGTKTQALINNFYHKSRNQCNHSWIGKS